MQGFKVLMDDAKPFSFSQRGTMLLDHYPYIAETAGYGRGKPTIGHTKGESSTLLAEKMCDMLISTAFFQ
jgi:hypothetical protein